MLAVKAPDANVFDWLLGEWTFVREIPHYATVRGEVRIAVVNDGAARYEETALVTLVQGETLRATQCYLFHRLPAPVNGFDVRFCDTNELFERLEFHPQPSGVLEARAHFLCAADTYESLFAVDPQDRLHVEHIVRGPRNNYRIATTYSRIEVV